jgi:hypothetical protein
VNSVVRWRRGPWPTCGDLRRPGEITLLCRGESGATIAVADADHQRFYGILIRMFFNDHAPPHFHARYGEFEATIDIDTMELLEGWPPQRALSLAQEWGMIHKEELLSNWPRCRDKAAPAKIEPPA